MMAVPKLALHSANFVGLSAIMLSPTGSGLVNLLVDDCQAAPLAPRKATTEGVTNVENSERLFQSIAVRPLVAHLHSYQTLQAGWDGPSSVAPSSAARAAAERFLLSLVVGTSLPEITVAGDGEISLSWRQANQYVDVSFFDDIGASFARINGIGAKARSVRSFSDLPKIAIDYLRGA